jgi:hypothetical protein
MKALRGAAIALFSALVFFGLTSGWFLVLNHPEQADVIVVLAGETAHRPARALELLSQNFAPRILLNVPADEKVYSRTTLQLAREYVDGLSQRNTVMICPIVGLSTRAESGDVAKCLQNSDIHNVLLVTSDFHTRRALSTFRHQLPKYHFSVAAAYDPQQFGTDWWRHRQWAKQNLDEWFRLMWWECVDRWR